MKSVSESKTEIIIMFPCLQATTANSFKHKNGRNIYQYQQWWVLPI